VDPRLNVDEETLAVVAMRPVVNVAVVRRVVDLLVAVLPAVMPPLEVAVDLVPMPRT
jgi:hypothetical protein